MTNMVKSTLSMLPMDDIVAELRSDKPNRKFMSKYDKAVDVEFVAGISAENIAQAVSSTRRDTVNNALNLNGRPADEYLNKEEGEKILGISNKMTEIFSGETQNQRDESYQVMAELAKKGFINDVNRYEGFIDAFKRSNKKYISYVCGINKAIVGNTNELFIADLTKKSYFEKGKKFVIKRADLEREIVVTSTGVTGSGKVEFTPTVNILDSIETVELHKSAGEYVIDSFSFSEVKRNVTDPQKEKYHMQSDDTRTALKTINESNTGYAVYFKVPNYAVGALTKFNVFAKAEGTPGALICHVLKKESVINPDGSFECKFKNIEEAKEKEYLIATSQPIQAEVAKNEKEISFDFFNVTTNQYPVLESNQYLFIVECISATEQDNWKLRFSYYENGNSEVEDLQRYNKTYVYKRVTENGLTRDAMAIQNIDGIDRYDMLFALCTRELIDEDEMGKQEGLYTAHIILPKPIDISKARLTTRINREGCYYLESHNTNYTIFNLAKESSTSHPVNDVRFKEDDIIIIGNNKGIVKRVSGNQVEVKEPVYLDKRLDVLYTRNEYNPDTQQYEDVTKIPVYRMNYDVSLKASLIDWDRWDDENNQFATKDVTKEPIALEFKSIVADGIKTNRRISDRLVFENDLGNNEDNVAKVANELELQIHWKSPFAYNEINDFKDLNDNNFKELIGRLHDIVLSLSKSY